MKRRFRIHNLGCANCAAKMEYQFAALTGVKSASIDMGHNILTVEDDGSTKTETLNKIASAIEPDVGFEPFVEGQEHELGHESEDLKKEGVKYAAACILALFTVFYASSLNENAALLLRAVAYVAAAYPVLRAAAMLLRSRNFLNEFFLMSFASLCALAIGKYGEALSVVLFYRAGEFAEQWAAGKSRGRIRSLIAEKPHFARVLRGDAYVDVAPDDVASGDHVLVKPGEKIPVDGLVMEGSSFVDASSLTGEHRPYSVAVGDSVYGGSTNTTGVITISAEGGYRDSSAARMLEMVEEAVANRAPTERFITTFARYYTPAIFTLAALVALVPPLLNWGGYETWLYRALVLLVISCPCALVISIPLGYFGGIGAASRRGILVKGGYVFDALAKVNTVFFDKTGTLTEGVFAVSGAYPAAGVESSELERTAAWAETLSNHPIARSVVAAYGKLLASGETATGEEIAGRGVRATDHDGEVILAGSGTLMAEEGVEGVTRENEAGSTVHVAKGKRYLGYITVSDRVRTSSAAAVSALRKNGIKNVYMLTGDREEAAASVARETGVDGYRAGLLPQDKVHAITELSGGSGEEAAFVGDGINDAPALVTSAIGIAMGGLGADVAVEASDAVIAGDSPAKVGELLAVASFTRRVVWQNIIAAMGVKAFFIVLGAIGVAGLWEAIFADVGVALLAVLNATRTVGLKVGQ